MRKTGVAAAVASMTCVLAGEAQATEVLGLEFPRSHSNYFQRTVVYVSGEPGEINAPRMRIIANPLGVAAGSLSALEPVADTVPWTFVPGVGYVVVPAQLLRSQRWIEVSDPGNTMRESLPATGLCAAAADRVFCGLRDGFRLDLFVDLADRDETYAPVIGGELIDRVSGGAGNDTLRMSNPDPAAWVVMSGGQGDDVLDGRGVAGTADIWGDEDQDVLQGGPGDDRLSGGPGTDDISGGPGTDSASWGSATSGVAVVLDGLAGDGQPGEDDHLRADVESASGSPFADLLIGNDGPNSLFGSDGGDRIEGQGGDDVINGNIGDDELTGGSGRDDVIGERGDDVLDVVDGEADRYNCGIGTDTLDADALDVFFNPPGQPGPTNCEALL